MKRSNVALSFLGAVGFAVSLGAGLSAGGTTTVSDDDAARLVGGQICEARKIAMRCRRLDPANCTELVAACYYPESGAQVQLSDPCPCGNCGTLYNSFTDCFE